MEAGRSPRARVENNLDKDCIVHVFGFPGYTQPQDIIRTFASIGKVTVQAIHHRNATLLFTNAHDAKTAIKSTLSIYGQVLAVKPYNEIQFKKNSTHKRDFTRSKQKGVIIQPADIDLSTGDFLKHVDNIMCAVRLTQEEVFKICSLYSDLENLLQELWPGATAVPFGSIPTGLGIKSSDADCFVKIPPQYRHINCNYVNKTSRLLRQYPKKFTEVLPIPRANTPIIKFFHVPTETNCDITFKTELGYRNSSLISFLLRADPRLIPMAVVIKYWAKINDISGTGKLTNYALTLLIVFYLQQPDIGILPAIQWLQQDPRDECIIDNWNTGFMNRLEALPPITNKSTLSELIGGFFEYYSTFNFEKKVVCTYLGRCIDKDCFKDLDSLPEGFDRYKDNVMFRLSMPMRFTTSWCIQDPFELAHNISSPVSSRLATVSTAYLKFAADAYRKEKETNCEKFLKIILCEKPKITKEKGNPEFRSNLFPKFINSIVNPDWKSVVRDIIFTIFETMLKIKLGKVEEKVNPDSKKEKEKYMGTVTKSIWKRKNACKLYNRTTMDLQHKQKAITEEVMRTEKTLVNIQFQLMLTYCHEPKQAVVAIKLNNGDIAIFKEFGKFFISVLQNWFKTLLEPHTKKSQMETAAKLSETIKFLDSNNLDIKNFDSDDDDDDFNRLLQESEAETPY